MRSSRCKIEPKQPIECSSFDWPKRTCFNNELSSAAKVSLFRVKSGPLMAVGEDEATSGSLVNTGESEKPISLAEAARKRLRSQLSLLSFASSGRGGTSGSKPAPIEDEFLRRFTVNSSINSRTSTTTKTAAQQNDQIDEETSISQAGSCRSPTAGGSGRCLIWARQRLRRKLSFVIDPSQNFHYRWLMIISLAVCYNMIFVIGRGIFWTLHNLRPRLWARLDLMSDLIYLVDMLIHWRTGYLEQGILVRQSDKLARHYLGSFAFKLDLLSLLPTEFFASLLLTPSDLGSHHELECPVNRVPCAWVIVRLNRLFRFHRLTRFFERTESATNFPFAFRISKLLFYILLIIHWNACLYFAVSYVLGFGSDHWVYQPVVVTSNTNSGNISRTTDQAPSQPPAHMANYDNELIHQYIYCFYWSTLTLTTIGEVPMPERDEEYLFVVIDFLVGLLIFATIVGNIGSMITNMNAARADFQHRMDSVKQWMKFRKVNKELEERIIRWFDYLWLNRQTLDEDAVTAILPDRLKAETAIYVHLETLKRVHLFQDCEPGLLVQLVLKLKLQVFSPGDFICRVGDVGKEMYIVKRGELSVLAEDCKTVFGTLLDGSVFGELSILNIEGVRTGNRRTANVRSVGYSDLFALSKQDLWQVLEDYPEAKTVLVDRGKQILRKDGLLDSEPPLDLADAKQLMKTDPLPVKLDDQLAKLESMLISSQILVERLEEIIENSKLSQLKLDDWLDKRVSDGSSQTASKTPITTANNGLEPLTERWPACD